MATAEWASSSDFVTVAKGKGSSQMVFKLFIKGCITSSGTFPGKRLLFFLPTFF